jgi:hypothetical protein
MAPKQPPEPKSGRPASAKPKQSASASKVASPKTAASKTLASTVKDDVIEAVAVEVVDKKPAAETPSKSSRKDNTGKPALSKPDASATPGTSAGKPRSSFVPVVTAIAATIVVAGAVFVFLRGDTGTQMFERNSVEIEVLAAELADLRAAINDQKIPEAIDNSAALESLQTDIGDLRSQSEGVLSKVATLEENLGNLERKIDTINLTALPVEAGDLAAQRALLVQQTEAFAAETARLQAAADAAEAQVERLSDKVSQSETLALQSMGVLQLNSALETGIGFASAVELLQSAGIAVPDALNSFASSGVSTMSELLASFPSTARAAIQADEQNTDGKSVTSRFSSFLKSQVSARALEPTEGETASAVLSRAEALLRDGDLSAALAEISALSEDAKAAMETWLVPATGRQKATEGFEQLKSTTTVQAN